MFCELFVTRCIKKIFVFAALSLVVMVSQGEAQVAYGVISNVDLVQPDRMSWIEDVSFSDDILISTNVQQVSEEIVLTEDLSLVESGEKEEIIPSINETQEKSERIARINDSKNLEELISKVKWQFDSYQLADSARQDLDNIYLDETNYENLIQEHKWNFEFRELEDYVN